jgi:hypothetical protein
MLKYLSAATDPSWLRANGAGQVVTQVVVAETAVAHSGRYRCEPAEAPPDQVVVHVLDGEREIGRQRVDGPNFGGIWKVWWDKREFF